MASKTEKARGNGPNPNAVVYHDSADIAPSLLSLQASRLTRRCAVSAAMAQTIAPMIYGEAQ